MRIIVCLLKSFCCFNIEKFLARRVVGVGIAYRIQQLRSFVATLNVNRLDISRFHMFSSIHNFQFFFAKYSFLIVFLHTLSLGYFFFTSFPFFLSSHQAQNQHISVKVKTKFDGLSNFKYTRGIYEPQVLRFFHNLP